MNAAEDAGLELARRLRSLRKQGWPGKRITQDQLAQAFNVSVPLISSWERYRDPVLPPDHRLEAYARFFATSRSVDRQPFRLISGLTDDEAAARDSLLAELTQLRERARGNDLSGTTPPFVDNLWRFPINEDITIVCSELPERLRRELPFTDPEDPDYVALYRYSDLDALLELHGHVRAMNPGNNVYVRTGSGGVLLPTSTPATWCCWAGSTGTRSPPRSCTASTCRYDNRNGQTVPARERSRSSRTA